MIPAKFQEHPQRKKMKTSAILEKVKTDVRSALSHLEYSFKKLGSCPWDVEWDEEQLEVLESFSSRFARSSDLIISRLLRLKALETDPAFRGTLIDLLNLSEKLSWIDSSATWLRIRELRNVAAHEYATDDLKSLYRELYSLAPHLLACRKLL
jgi:hypothetical protein